MTDSTETAPEGTSDGLQALIDKYAHGQASADDVAQAVRVTGDPNRPSGDLTFQQSYQRQMEDDNDYTGTFSEIAAAWIAGEITDAQFEELRTAVTPEGAAIGNEIHQGAEGDPADNAADQTTGENTPADKDQPKPPTTN